MRNARARSGPRDGEEPNQGIPQAVAASLEAKASQILAKLDPTVVRQIRAKHKDFSKNLYRLLSMKERVTKLDSDVVGMGLNGPQRPSGEVEVVVKVPDSDGGSGSPTALAHS